MDSTLSFASKLARTTASLLFDYFQHDGTVSQVKDDWSVVTDADLAADQHITHAILEEYPGDFILSEERQTSLPAELPNAVWVVDPLDGTTNFSLGLPFWGVSIARLVDGWPEVAALCFPALPELYTVQRCGGAFLNGEPIHVKPPLPDHPAAFFSCCGRTHRRYNIRVPYKPRILGSAAYGLCAVGRGVAVLGFEATPKIWDISGAWLLVEEAGGRVEPHSGPVPFPLKPGTDYSHQSYPTLAGATPDLVAKARRQILPRELPT